MQDQAETIRQGKSAEEEAPAASGGEGSDGSEAEEVDPGRRGVRRRVDMRGVDVAAEIDRRDPEIEGQPVRGSRIRRCGSRGGDVEEVADERVSAAVAFADASPEPDVSELARSVYAPGSGGQFARMRPGSPFGEEALVFDSGLGS